MAAKFIFLDPLLNSRMYSSVVYVEIHAGAASGGGVRQLTIISSGSRIFLGGHKLPKWDYFANFLPNAA